MARMSKTPVPGVQQSSEMCAMTGVHDFPSLVHHLYFPSFLLHPSSGTLEWLSCSCYCCDGCCSLQHCQLSATSALPGFLILPWCHQLSLLCCRKSMSKERLLERSLLSSVVLQYLSYYVCVPVCAGDSLCVQTTQGTTLQSHFSPANCEIQG